MTARRWIVGALLVGGLVYFFTAGSGPEIADGSLLVIDVQGEYVDGNVSPFARLFGRQERSLLGFTSQLRKAERDARIESVLFRVRAVDLGWGKAEEMRAAIVRLGEKGKKTVALLELEGYGNAAYYVASGAQRVVATPASRNPFIGLAAEYLLFGGTLAKVGVEVEYERIGRYKSAAESYAESKLSDPAREMANALLDSVLAQFVKQIAATRKLDEAAVRAAIDQGPSTPEQWKQLGLLDDVLWYDELLGSLGDPARVEADIYTAVTPESVGFAPKATFAVVYGAGPVVVGEGEFDGSGDRVMSSDTVAQALEDAAENADVRAIVLRIDSPGGSPLASDLIWRAVRRAQQAGKPVIASLSDVAASGGYYVACAADRIVSQPQTLTGSIGVFTLRPVLTGLYEKLGLGVESLTRGARADLLLSNQRLSPETRALLQQEVASIYEQFVARVAEGRSLDAVAVDAVGQGRVWTGEQALANKLVDALGGIPEAVALGREAVGLAADDDVLLLVYPQPKPLAEQVTELFQQTRAQLGVPLPRALRQLRTLLETHPSGAPLFVPPALVEIR